MAPAGRLFQLPTRPEFTARPCWHFQSCYGFFLLLPTLCQQQVQTEGVLLPSLHCKAARRLRARPEALNQEDDLGGICVWWDGWHLPEQVPGRLPALQRQPFPPFSLEFLLQYFSGNQEYSPFVTIQHLFIYFRKERQLLSCYVLPCN